MDRTVIGLNENWRFHLGECEEAWYKGYDDGGWRSVMLPHDWSVELPFSEKYSSGTGYLAGGIGWYRLHFGLPEEYEGKSVRLVFDGVYKNSQVWCNSYYLGKRPNGYITFSYDITDFVHFGEAGNEISVKVTHTDLADSRWFTGSGITRKVSLVIEEPVHPVPYGIFFRTTGVENGAEKFADVEICHEIENRGGWDVSVEAVTVLTDETGTEAVRLTGRALLGAGSCGGLRMAGRVNRVRLWSTECPHLYRMDTYYSVNGEAPYLAGRERVGIRTFLFDPDRGFFLNGRETKIRGVCVHHDGGCLGAAVTAEVWERRLERLKECGCNAIRCSHNPHMPELYGLCDEMGFLMMDEAFDEWENAKNKWWAGHNVYPPAHQGYFEDFPQWHQQDLKDMVRRDRNHPSVILWSIGNEIDYPNDPYCHPMFRTMTGNNDAQKPAAERAYDENKPNAERLAVLAGRLADIVRQEDDSRPVTLAAAFPELSSRLGFLDPLDVVGYNYKENLYEEDHRRFPGKPFLGSENGHGYEAWRAVADHPYISGQFLWTGIDYLGEAHGWPIRGSRAGLLTCAGDRKPEFYRRKSFWSEDKMLHIASGRENRSPMEESWNYTPGEMVLVKCYSNLPQVRLFLNGKEAGWQRGYNDDGAYVFPVAYEEGCLKAEGLDSEGCVCITKKLMTASSAEKLECRIWKRAGRGQEPPAAGGMAGTRRGGEKGYLYQLEFRLVDREGRRTVGDDREVRVTVSGGGELAGLENGCLEDITPYSSSFRSTWQGRLLAYVRRTDTGEINVTAEVGTGEISYCETIQVD